MKMVAMMILAGAASAGEAAPVTVELDGVRDGGGPLYVSVQTREQFMQDAGTDGTIVQAPRAGAHRFTYDLPAGQYVVSVWHDDNGNGAFDKDSRHMPLDGWALTNSAALRGEPSFDQVKFATGGQPMTLRLSMTYGR
jgi:uncharacterized protein (DUF2141 family)